MKSEFALAFNEVLEEKGLPREVVLAALESAMISAYRKTVGASAAQDVQVKLDFDSGNVSVFAEKEVTDEIYDERTEVLLEDALLVDPEAKLGDLVMVESTQRILAASPHKQHVRRSNSAYAMLKDSVSMSISASRLVRLPAVSSKL